MALGDVYQFSSSRVKDVKPGRLVTFTDRNNVRDAKTGKCIHRLSALIVDEATPLHGKIAIMISGYPSKIDGTPRANAQRQKVVACDGAFMVWWK